jgi:hypothetical protein
LFASLPNLGIAGREKALEDFGNLMGFSVLAGTKFQPATFE